jgi:hypothetical protein
MVVTGLPGAIGNPLQDKYGLIFNVIGQLNVVGCEF